MIDPNIRAEEAGQRLFVAGGSGFLGKHLGIYARTKNLPITLSYFSRPPQSASMLDCTQRESWVYFDTSSIAIMEKAMRGHDVVVYAIHRMSEATRYPELEHDDAKRFTQAAALAGIKKIIYIGGVYPETADQSPHLRSRKRTGDVLRSASDIPVVEIRASMIIGAGSISWQLVSSFATLSPILALPNWMRNTSWPVGVRDVVDAVLKVSTVSDDQHQIYDLPGPKQISHQGVIALAADVIGKPLRIIPLPFSISADFTKIIVKTLAMTGALDVGHSGIIAAELVYGLQGHLEPTQQNLRSRLNDLCLTSLSDAMRDAL